MTDCVDQSPGSGETDADDRIAFRIAGIFGIRIPDQLDREIAFSATWPKCSLEEFFNKIDPKRTPGRSTQLRPAIRNPLDDGPPQCKARAADIQG